MIALRRHDDTATRRAFLLKAGLLLFGILVFVLAGTYSARAEQPFPDILPLPSGFSPEGIAVGRGTDFYVGSLADGSIYKGDLRTGEGAVLVPAAPGRPITGLKVDKRTNYIFAAGAATGMGFVFDGSSGATIRSYQFTAAPNFINDVVLTRDAAYFTNSNQPEIYKVPLGPGGEPAGTFEVIPLSGDYVQGAGFNANGIDATPNGKTLVIVQTVTGYLYSVDPATGVATRIDLGGATVTNGDGILLLGKTLYVVRNQNNEIVVIDLDLKTNTGTVVDSITDSDFRVPTTIAQFGKWLYAVNAYFGKANPTGQFEVVQVRR
ncbi:MAG: superoxide dismutase [Nitrososphaerales archaeon]